MITRITPLYSGEEEDLEDSTRSDVIELRKAYLYNSEGAYHSAKGLISVDFSIFFRKDMWI
jgi:hypothetical protein